MSAFLILGVLVLVLYKLFSQTTIKWKQVSKYGDSKVTVLKEAPGPIPLPIIGNLHLLGKYESPFQVFSELSKEYGGIFSLTLGTTKCVVVNNVELIKEVLNQNGKFFGGRPDFIRYHKIFAGNRNNSSVLSDWSNLQTRRRIISRRHCCPKHHTDNYARIGSVSTFESVELVQTLKSMVGSGHSVNIKPYLLSTMMNIFSHYTCSIRFDAETDLEFRKIVELFDAIFFEINQGYAIDFLPWLSPFYTKHLDKLYNWSQEIRSFISRRIIEQRDLNIDVNAPKKDFLDDLLDVLHNDPNFDRNTISFMIEDFIGGHSSVATLVLLCLTAIAKNPEVGSRIRSEIEEVTEGNRPVYLTDRSRLPYTEATVLECLRCASSPIVPHVATENVALAGYGVKKGSIVFLNNYELNSSEQYWVEPKKFDPSRFLELTSSDSGTDSDHETKSSESNDKRWSIKRNIPHFIPFSVGKRTCVGQTMVTMTAFLMLANVTQAFEITGENLDSFKQKPACVAMPKDPYDLYLKPIKH